MQFYANKLRQNIGLQTKVNMMSHYDVTNIE